MALYRFDHTANPALLRQSLGQLLGLRLQVAKRMAKRKRSPRQTRPGWCRVCGLEFQQSYWGRRRRLYCRPAHRTQAYLARLKENDKAAQLGPGWEQAEAVAREEARLGMSLEEAMRRDRERFAEYPRQGR
jgi:hypothetical protein